MEIHQKIKAIEEEFMNRCYFLLRNYKILSSIQKSSNPLVYIEKNRKGILHIGKLSEIDEDIRMSIIEKEFESDTLEILEIKIKVTLKNCISYFLKNDFPRIETSEIKSLAISGNDKVLTLPENVKEIDDYILSEECKNLKQYLKNLKYPDLYEKCFGEKPW